MKNVRKIVITGPESTGKSALADALAKHYRTVCTPEYARVYLNQLDRPYREEDLPHIAKGQIAHEEEKGRQANGLLFCDTSLVVLKIWSEYKYGRCHSYILQALRDRTYDLFLLCRPDLPWTFDPLRENPNNRVELFDLYQRELQQMDVAYAEIGDRGALRTQNAIDVIQQHFFQ